MDNPSTGTTAEERAHRRRALTEFGLRRDPGASDQLIASEPIVQQRQSKTVRTDDSRIHYLMLAVALGLLVAAAAVRSLAGGPDGQPGRLAHERQDFHRWTQATVPLIVRYRAVLRVDAPLVRGLHPWRPQPGLRLRIQRAERILLDLEHSTGPLAARSPPDLRSFAPLLRRALALARAAQQTYATALSRPAAARPSARAQVGRGSTLLLRRGNRLLRRSQQAMAAFTTQVNNVGAQLLTR